MSLLNAEENKQLITLRKWLHQNPELSGREKNTSEKILDFVRQTKPDKIIENLGGYGVAVIHNFSDEGPTVLVRADMDALPIDEVNTFSHKSQTPGVAHKCGHDGHSTILSGLSIALKKQPLSKGRVVLLFQPEEETGKGAEKVIEDEAFKMIQPDFCIALHNLPGFKKHSVVWGKGVFASASTGMIIKMSGLSSHAAHPEEGNSPADMLAETMMMIPQIPEKRSDKFKGFALATVIHAKLGEIAFGTNPGEAVLMATLRTHLNRDMETLKKEAERICRNAAEEYNIKIEIRYTEEFPATTNHDDMVGILKNAAQKSDTPTIEITEPFRWSEDFGHFSSRFPSLLFGLGSGTDSPGLHNNDYDFPDEIIPDAVKIFYEMCNHITQIKSI